MHYDIIIIGGGLVGRSLAHALNETALKIALIDASAQELPDPRLIALNYGSHCFLKSLGLWPALEAKASAIREVQVSHRGRFGATRLEADAIHLPALGYVVRAQHINQALIQAMQTAARPLEEIRPARVSALELHDQTSFLTVEQGQSKTRLSANLVLAADGTESTVRQLLNIETKTVDYQQSALVTTTTLSRSHGHVAYERFLQDGALAMLPLHDDQDHRCATIWSASNAAIQALQALDEPAFLRQLQTQLGYRLGRLRGITQRHTFPLRFIQALNPIRGNVVLLGNAAHTIHPIAAQGLNLAWYEIAHLAQALLINVREGQPLIQGLADKISQFQPKMNLLFSHYLSELFTSPAWGMNLARQAGLVGLDLCPPLKKRFSRIMAMESMRWLTP